MTKEELIEKRDYYHKEIIKSNRMIKRVLIPFLLLFFVGILMILIIASIYGGNPKDLAFYFIFYIGVGFLVLSLIFMILYLILVFKIKKYQRFYSSISSEIYHNTYNHIEN